MPSLIKSSGSYAAAAAFKVKASGSYVDPVAILAKSAGVYTAISGIGGFNPASLFTTEQGTVFDMTDFASMFQSRDGVTTPVTAVEQVVGYQRDLSGKGNHRFATADANRPLLSARLNQYLATATLSTQGVTTLATNYTLAFSGAGTITLSGTATGVYTAGSYTVVCTEGTLTSTVVGTVTSADLRPTNQAPSTNVPLYQRVTTSSDYETVGFPHYLKYNGVNQFLQSVSSIDYTGTAKITAVCGARKLSDSLGFVSELSTITNTTNGGIYTALGSNGGRNYSLGGRGTLYAVEGPSSPLAPHTAALHCIFDISAPLLSISVNAGAPTTTAANQGAGNYGNHITYYGSRAGTIFFLNGYEYSSVTIGSLLTAPKTAILKEWVRLKSGAY